MEKQLKTLQSKLSNIEKKEAKKPKDNQLFNDCVATLMTLGYKSKRVAKNDVSDFLENNDIISVDQFVNEFFIKAKKT
jgi:Holliday junction resolvasome RuvABC DNA-binding subunit